jgi:hypothetical protein
VKRMRCIMREETILMVQLFILMYRKIVI